MIWRQIYVWQQNFKIYACICLYISHESICQVKENKKELDIDEKSCFKTDKNSYNLRKKERKKSTFYVDFSNLFFENVTILNYLWPMGVWMHCKYTTHLSGGFWNRKKTPEKYLKKHAKTTNENFWTKVNVRKNH